MLDAEGYPTAFLVYGDFRIEFCNARLGIDNIDTCATFVMTDKKS